MSEDMLNVMGSFISTELDAFENLYKELEEKDKEIERLTEINKNLENAISLNNIRKLQQENDKLHSIIKEVREYANKYNDKIQKDILEILDKENI